jgi:predicted HTH domain antitoxin
MKNVVTMRLPEEVINELEDIAKTEHLDRVSLIRKMLLEDVERYRLKRAADRYMRGRISIEEAAVRAKVSVWRMVEYLREENINPQPETLEELKEGLARTEGILKGAIK